MSGLNEQEREALNEAVAKAGLGRGYWTSLYAAVERILAARTEQARPGLCSQCGEQPSVMVKVGTSDGWCTACLDEAAEVRPEHVVRAEALREAADECPFMDPESADEVIDWLRDRADALEAKP